MRLSTDCDIKTKKDQLQLFVASSEIVKSFLKRQALKDPKLMPLDKVLYRWLTAVSSEGKPLTGPLMIESTKSYDDVKITDKCTFSDYLCNQV